VMYAEYIEVPGEFGVSPIVVDMVITVS